MTGIKEKVFWTTKMNLQLIKFMHQRPYMWDSNHRFYYKLRLRTKAFSEFAALYGNKFSAYTVRERWSNIRSTYSRYRRKIEEFKKMKPTKVYNPKWVLWDSLTFLSPIKKKYHKFIAAYSDENLKSDPDMNSGYNSDENNKVIENESDPCADNAGKVKAFALKGQYIDTFDMQSISKAGCKTLAKDIVNAFQTLQDDLYGIRNSKYDKLGKLIAEKLSQLNSLQRLSLMKKILDILIKYDNSNSTNIYVEIS